MNPINHRISDCIRVLGITKTEFAERLNISQPFVSQLTNGSSLPSDRTVADICREFNVSEVWLRTGEGDMLIRLPEDAEFDLMMTQIQESDDSLIKAILRAYWNLPDEKKAAIRDLVDGIISNLEKEKTGD